MTTATVCIRDRSKSPSSFTGKERDQESGNDYFGKRYYASSMGRWLSPDLVKITGKRLVDPQRLNLYGYARNNPLLYLDDNGMDIHILVTNVAVGQATLNRYTQAELRANPDLKQEQKTVSTYRVFVTNDSGQGRMIAVTRDTWGTATNPQSRGTYGTNSETPPGTYSVDQRTTQGLGWHTTISDLDNPGSATVTGPDGTRTGLATHIGDPGASEGCFLVGGGRTGLNNYHTDINDLLNQDRANGLGTDMYETVQDRNDLPQTEQPEFNQQISTQPLQQMSNMPTSNVQN